MDQKKLILFSLLLSTSSMLFIFFTNDTVMKNGALIIGLIGIALLVVLQIKIIWKNDLKE